MEYIVQCMKNVVLYSVQYIVQCMHNVVCALCTVEYIVQCMHNVVCVQCMQNVFTIFFIGNQKYFKQGLPKVNCKTKHIHLQFS